MDTDWMSQGNCRAMDPALFFPSDGIGVQAAQRVCAECVVKSLCLQYALVNKIDEGVWGGASERHRKRLLSQHRRQAAGARQVRVSDSAGGWGRR
jgi:WhiB family redox-sensing transcriptional regulator